MQIFRAKTIKLAAKLNLVRSVAELEKLLSQATTKVRCEKDYNRQLHSFMDFLNSPKYRDVTPRVVPPV